MAGSSVTVTVEGIEAVRKVFEQQRKDFRKAQKIRMGRALNVVRAEVRAQARGLFQRHSGRMQRAIGRRIYDSGGPEIQGQVAFFRRGYYAIHERGGVIRARKAPFLAFPVLGTFGGRGILAGARGVRGWARVKSVTIPPRPFFIRAADVRRDQVTSILGSSFDVFTESSPR